MLNLKRRETGAPVFHLVNIKPEIKNEENFVSLLYAYTARPEMSRSFAR